LARDLGISRNTVEAAFEQLRAEGFVERRVGVGTRISSAVGEHLPFRFGPAPYGDSFPRRQSPHPGKERMLSSRGERMSSAGAEELHYDAHSGPCATDVSHFPLDTWNRIASRSARSAAADMLVLDDPRGFPALREAIAEHARLTRGVRCHTDQVLVLNSTQQALMLASLLLLDPGQTAVIEDPGYLRARAALLAGGATVAGVPVDDAGLMTSRLPAGGVRVVYVTPSHQFPLGVTMSLARRLELLTWAEEHDAWILEDDYDSEFRFEGRQIAALQGLDEQDRVLYLGTFNKVLFPGMRVAYLILPPSLVERFAQGRLVFDGPAHPLTQGALAEFIRGGHLGRHLRRARQLYATRRDALVRAIGRHWSDWIRSGPSHTGLHLVAHLPEGTDDRAVFESLTAGARSIPLGIAPLSRYFHGEGPRPGLLLSYGAATSAEIELEVERLTPLLRGMVS